MEINRSFYYIEASNDILRYIFVYSPVKDIVLIAGMSALVITLDLEEPEIITKLKNRKDITIKKL